MILVDLAVLMMVVVVMVIVMVAVVMPVGAGALEYKLFLASWGCLDPESFRHSRKFDMVVVRRM